MTALALIVELRLARSEPPRNEMQDIEDEFYVARGYTDIKAAIPSPSITQKEEIREGLKQAFFAKNTFSFSFAFRYTRSLFSLHWNRFTW